MKINSDLAHTRYLRVGCRAERRRAAEEAGPGEGGAEGADSNEPPPKRRHAVLLPCASHDLCAWNNDYKIEESKSVFVCEPDHEHEEIPALLPPTFMGQSGVQIKLQSQD